MPNANCGKEKKRHEIEGKSRRRRPSPTPFQQQLVDSETGDGVESADKGRGYEIRRNQYLPVEDEELEALRLESTHTIDIEKFVPRSTSAISTAPTTSCPRTRSGRTPLRSFARR